MITVSQAKKIVDREVEPLGSERVEIAEAVGRVLAEGIVADHDLPPFDRSQMDGYAVRAADTANAPVILKLVGESAAGRGWRGTLKKGDAVRIMTGAPVPKGADAVQRLEEAIEKNGSVEILRSAEKGLSVVRCGAEIRKGTLVFNAGERVTENMIAALASFGYAKLKTGRRPRVAILATGSEIVDITKRPGRDQIRNSNSPMLAALCRRFGAIPESLHSTVDDISLLKKQVSIAAKQSDILIMTGGVSVGKYDHTKTALDGLGAEVFLEKLRLKPGKPMVFARLGKTLVFGLPGNPVSAAVTFHLFVRRVILAMQGASDKDCSSGYAIAKRDVRGTRDRDAYLPATLASDKQGRLIVDAVKGSGSSDLISLSRAQVLMSVPRGTIAKKGEPVKILYL